MKFNSALYCLVLACVSPLYGAQPVVTRSTSSSPSGNISVKVEVLAHSTFTLPMANIDEVNNVQYSIKFWGVRKKRAEATYTDVYGWGDETATPAPTANIFGQLTWSPKEDFVILPEEHWAGAPSSPIRTAVNLNPEVHWSTAYVHMDIVAWADDFKVAGNLHSDCDYRVVLFDGRSGQVEDVRKSTIQSHGFAISNSSGTRITIESLLDNCRMESDELSFKKTCEELDLKSMSSAPVPCKNP